MSELISILIPTKNSEKNLEILFESLINSSYQNFEVIINDDKGTLDNTLEICNKFKKKNLNITYLKENYSMAQGRKRAAEYSAGDILIHLDSDMKLSTLLLEECLRLINEGYDALVIPEESYGSSFWAKCKWLEKKCYEGNPNIESLRCIKREVYFKVGGHNEKMIFSEDKDLDIRVRKKGYKIGRTLNYIYHNEGNLKLFNTLKKKIGYSKTANIFEKEHPIEFKWQSNPLNRYLIFILNIKYFFKHPFIYLGMVIMKTLEYLFAFLGFIFKRL